MSRPSEDDLIARYFAPLATLQGADGLRDDAAVLTPPDGASLVVTADALVSSVHFLPDDPPETVAAKALRVNLSDLAAKGAAPHAFTLSLALPGDWTEEWLAGFAAGLKRDVEAFGFALLGGDTVRTSGPLTIAVTAFGLVPSARIPRRGGARPGDALYVSGTIGDGALGLAVRRNEAAVSTLPQPMREALTQSYRMPQPRVALAPAVLACASASMDISDGFVGDLTKLLRASGTGAEIELAAVPLSEPVRTAIAGEPGLFERALTGGDDYEILCAVPPERCAAFEEQARAAGVAVTRIGIVVAGRAGASFRDRAGRERRFASGSFSHF